ncbi:hypothetical protein I302_101867 [Kwoniella bestiolae CBS 10118]|uniref:Uncharacterized protein n=1 Tax=Kwoniella bestiolae CBS 10118 TaxID=1296100 RepID=A0A1B9GDI5_9TREE|nr:hypothetical protein I302_00546 [Kwoniella bestiolae CBS 10118]OCF29055.1 hypothetical protein I302_00546 [Kwoniella bestiolae CBS 10118]
MSSTEEVDSGDVDNAAKLIREAVELRANAVNQKASDDFRRLAEASENGIISLSLNEIDQFTTKWYDNISTRPVTLLAEYRQEDVQAYRRQLKVMEEGCKNLNDGPTARDLDHTLKKLLKSIDLSSANTASGKQAIQELIHTGNMADERLAAAIAHRTIRQTILDEQAVFDRRKVHSLPNAEISSTIARSRRRYGDLRFNDEDSALFKSRAESLQHVYTSLRSEQLPKVKEGHRRRYQITSNDADGQKDILRQMEDLVSSHEYQIDLGQAPPCLRDIAILKDEHEELQWTHSQWRSKEVERFRTLLSVSGNLDARNRPSAQFDCIIELPRLRVTKGKTAS